ncbi:MAG: arginine deiminase [Treponema sp.]|nr:arginine deiminase [Treponema sp.]
MAGVNVGSEIGPLKKVLVHRPSRELLNLTPDTLAELLFDDIPFLKIARQEHDAFAGTMRENGAEVLYLEELMAEVLGTDGGIRKRFLEQYIMEAGIRTDAYYWVIYDYLNENYPENIDLVLKTMEGLNLSEIRTGRNSLAELTSDESRMIIPPMPNLYFTRDPFAMMGTGVSINRMYSATRCRETIYGEYIFKYHKDFDAVPRYYARDDHFHIEGGDVLNISREVVAVGISQRTEPDAIELLAKNVFGSESPIRKILAFSIPNSRAFMHLDTVFSQIDHDKFTVHEDILGPLRVYEITPAAEGGIAIKAIDEDLQRLLSRYLKCDVRLILCAGGEKIAAAREQWNDGSNTLCISPGKVIAYDRNEITNDLLRESGVTVLEVASSELSRGRGGPRCMTMPIWRDG